MKLLYTLTIIACLHGLARVPASAQPQGYTNSLGMQFVLIKPGTFVAGKFQPPYPKPIAITTDVSIPAPEKKFTSAQYALAAKLAKQHTMPGFTVHISAPFYIGIHEVTQGQWKQVMGNNPSIFKGNKVDDDADQHPVDNVTWGAVQVFLKKLNLISKGTSYRLPAEFEWEYAARAGAEDDIPWSEIRLSAQTGTRTTQRVAQKKPNAWGLYDMLGNVWEWVQDYYNEKPFADPAPPKSGREHVLKGASFVGDVKNATYMTHAAGPANKWDTGFRIVMEVSSHQHTTKGGGTKE